MLKITLKITNKLIFSSNPLSFYKRSYNLLQFLTIKSDFIIVFIICIIKILILEMKRTQCIIVNNCFAIPISNYIVDVASYFIIILPMAKPKKRVAYPIKILFCDIEQEIYEYVT